MADTQQIDYLSKIKLDLEANRFADTSEINCGMFQLKSANKSLEESSMTSEPGALWKTLWNEGEVCCLFSDRCLGKSILAIQIAEEIARKQKVLYFDFELSNKQFEKRYSNDGMNCQCDEIHLHRFPESLFRVTLDRTQMGLGNNLENLMSGMQQAVVTTGSKVLVIDSLSNLCNGLTKTNVMGKVMATLTEMAHTHNLSVLVLFRTSKRFLSTPIRWDNIDGRKRLHNFFDSAFAIGQSFLSPKLRYIIQVKGKRNPFVHGKDNVIVCEIKKLGDAPKFVEVELANEKIHLRSNLQEEQMEFLQEIRQLQENGLTIREIADLKNISKTRIFRLLDKVDKSSPLYYHVKFQE